MFYSVGMAKTITQNQMIGEIGEAAARLRFLTMGFQFDVRSRLEAGIDAIVEVMDKGRPLARMIAVQVKATEGRTYSSEDDNGFTYLLKAEDLKYWKGSNLPVIIVLYRQSDETFYWQSVLDGGAKAGIKGCSAGSGVVVPWPKVRTSVNMAIRDVGKGQSRPISKFKSVTDAK